MSYQETLNSHKAELIRLNSERIPLDLENIFRPVDWSQAESNQPYFGWLIQEKFVNRRDLDAARRRDQARAVLGKYPATCCEYVGAFLDMHAVSVKYTGTITLIDAATRECRSNIITELARDMRVLSSELGLPFQREAINDAVDAWYQDARAARIIAIRDSVGGGGGGGGAHFDWIELALRVFDCNETSPEFTAAVVRKFIHQVKLKLHGRSVGHHLMPVILGGQGIGKSSFMNKLVSPIAELARDADFKMLADERNIMLWRSYVLIIDEMAYADRSDIETVKHVITASTLDRRPMRTNDVVTINQCATFIGASNKTIAELVRDETGMRRFVGLEYRRDADWEYLNAIDWLAAWRSVSIEDADPMHEFRDQLAELQAASRHVSAVEAWLAQLSKVRCSSAAANGEHFGPKDLYNDYLSHFHDHNDQQKAKGFHAFQQELGRLIKSSPEAYQIEKQRTKSGNVWRWRLPLAIVEGRLAA